MGCSTRPCTAHLPAPFGTQRRIPGSFCCKAPLPVVHLVLPVHALHDSDSRNSGARIAHTTYYLKKPEVRSCSLNFNLASNSYLRACLMVINVCRVAMLPGTRIAESKDQETPTTDAVLGESMLCQYSTVFTSRSAKRGLSATSCCRHAAA